VVDRKNEKLAAIVSQQGGVEIEELSKSCPQAMKKEYFYPEQGLFVLSGQESGLFSRSSRSGL